MGKRRTATPDSDDDDNSQQSNPVTKRARTSTADQQISNRAAKSRRRDEEGSDEEDNAAAEDSDDDDDIKQYRADMDADPKRKTRGTIAEHGIIESIEMAQFMCHRFLQFTFGPQINFIIGHNGSGKSAVLSAITVVLGGKANSTGRGNGLKSFIREGQSASEVTISIKNQGEEAFKPKEYGKSIVITRRFTKEGASTWKIKSKDGRVISTKKDELAAICDHMNIQVDNPMNVLTQDSARQFLSASRPADKYKFFLRGTQLQQLSDEYDICLENIHATSKVLQQKGSALPDLQAAYDEAKARYEEASKAREQQKRVKDLHSELAWAHVIEKEKEMTKKAQEQAEAAGRILKIETHVQETDKLFNEATERVVETEAEFNNLGDIAHLHDQHAEIKSKLKAGRAKLLAFNSDIRTANTSLASCNEQIRQYEQQIEEESRRLAADTQAQRDESNRNIEAARQAIENTQQAITQLKEHRAACEAEVDALRAEGEPKDKIFKEAQETIKQIDHHLSQIQQSERNEFIAYGKDMSAVIAKIKQTRWRGDMPLGPLGRYIKIIEPEKWSTVLRAQMNNVLCSFAVTDAQDHKVLKKLMMDSKNNHVQITIFEKDLFDYSSGEPPAQFLTVLRALEVSDPHVLRILINQLHIESVVLARTRIEGEQALRDIRARGTGVAWTAEGHRLRRFPEGGEATQPIDFRNVNKMLFASQNTAHEKEKATRDRQEQVQIAQIAKAEASDLQRKWNAKRKELEAFTNKERVLNTELARAKSRLKTIQQEINDQLPANIGGLEQAKNDAEAEKASLVEQAGDIMLQKAAVDQDQKRLMDEQKEIDRQIKDWDQVRDAGQAKVVEASEARAQVQHKLAYYKGKLVEAQALLTQKKALFDHTEQEFKVWIQGAEKWSAERIETRASVKDLTRTIASLEAALKEREKRQGRTMEEISNDVTRTKEKLDAAGKDLKQMVALNKTLTASLNRRLTKWQEFRRHIALRCKVVFQHNLSNRGYYGKVLFDHDKGTLQLKVRTDDQASTQSRDKDPKSLSGGEKSFSTICLLLALWESIGCPLRCLDEFDVFMDAVNRRISMKMMIDTANQSDKKQYVLITPQDMGNIQIGPTIRVNRMNDPERGQGILSM